MKNQDNEAVSVSYGTLILELGRRINSGWRTHDQEYFSDLVFNLLANQRALERAIYDQNKQATAEMLGPCDSVN